jgi:hypothetical protein
MQESQESKRTIIRIWASENMSIMTNALVIAGQCIFLWYKDINYVSI